MSHQVPSLGRRTCQPSRDRRSRRGAVTLWTIISVPALLVLFCIVLEIGNLWYGRVELESGLEAAALAAVKEWAEQSSTANTDGPRCTGVKYASFNVINTSQITITKNRDTAADSSNPNENLYRDGDLIFGAITTDSAPWKFDANKPAGCGIATILFDASEQGGGAGTGGMGSVGAWGITYYANPDNPSLQIRAIEINLRANGGSGIFDFSTSGPSLSPMTNQKVVNLNVSVGQDDVVGFTDTSSQIMFDTSQASSGILTINFFPDTGLGGDPGFGPCNRIRFAAAVSGVGSGNASNDGDGIGLDQTKVTVWFYGTSTTAEGVFADTDDKKNQCPKDLVTDDSCLTRTNSSGGEVLIVHPSGLHSLPCPPSSAAKNNGQSYVLLSGGSGGKPAVRAQATHEVPTLCQKLFGMPVGPFKVSAHTTAMYDCATRRPRLIRVRPENYTPPARPLKP